MRRSVRVVTIACVVSVAADAAAQPGNTPPTYAPPAPSAPTTTTPTTTASLRGARSPETAVALSLGGTALSVAVLAIASEEDSDALGTTGAIGLFFAPSFGHWYAGDGWTPGMSLRLAGTAAASVGGLMAFSCFLSEGDCAEGPILVLVYGGMTAFVAGGVYDIGTAARAARTYNKRLEGRLRDVTVRPTFGTGRAGLALSGRF